MTLADITATAVNRIFGRLIRRAAAWFFVAVAALACLYQATVAATVALELEFGAIYAHLMIAAFYAVAAILTVAVLWMTGRKSFLALESSAGIERIPPELQIATIVEAMLLGYAMSRRK
jgi:hypothetical protein